jgi:hypothetical protein
MKRAFRFNTTAVAIAIGLIAISTTILSAFSYVHWVGKENLVDTTLKQSNDKRVSPYVDRIEQKIIDNDGILSEMIDINAPSLWPGAVDQIKNGEFNVDNVFIYRLDSKYPVYPPYANEIANSWHQCGTSFEELHKKHLVVNQTNHLHKERPDNYFFTSLRPEVFGFL